MLSRTLDAPNPWCALTFFPAPEGQAVKRLRTPPSKVLKEQRYRIRKEGSQNKLKKFQKGKSTRRDSNLRHRFA